ncbi:hypothetical protein BASA61_004951 [Batrachochytrium salamandrivorans]|nr:hypothetical protein BASA61_004951 [Batrachochytrium salamandrivorans]
MGKRQTPFQEQHAVKYGLSPVKKSLDSSVEIVQCLFCVHIGRERREGTGVKRQRTNNTHLFRFLFRLEYYESHLKTQHTNDWELYQTLSHQDKIELFNKKGRSGIHLHMDCDKDSLEFAISRPAIVDRVVMGLFSIQRRTRKARTPSPSQRPEP